MTKEEKTAFVETLCNDLKGFILSKVDKMPEEWDGVEIRQLMEDAVAQQYNWTKMSSKRKRDYNNEVVVRNIL